MSTARRSSSLLDGEPILKPIENSSPDGRGQYPFPHGFQTRRTNPITLWAMTPGTGQQPSLTNGRRLPIRRRRSCRSGLKPRIRRRSFRNWFRPADHRGHRTHRAHLHGRAAPADPVSRQRPDVCGKHDQRDPVRGGYRSIFPVDIRSLVPGKADDRPLVPCPSGPTAGKFCRDSTGLGESGPARQRSRHRRGQGGRARCPGAGNRGHQPVGSGPDGGLRW
jgi:hypothetical protein